MKDLLRLLSLVALCSLLSPQGSFAATPEQTNTTIIKDAIDISNRIIEDENVLKTLGLQSTYKDEVQWYTPSMKVDYGDDNCWQSDRDNYRQIVTKWINLATTYKIPFFLHAGSLIGAARNADIVPWDGDVDIMVDGRFNEVIAAIADERDFSMWSEDSHLVIQKDFRKPVPDSKKDSLYYTEHRRRWNCQGTQVESQVDSCSFQEPFARLVRKGRHMDIYDYLHKDDFIYDAAQDKFPAAMVFPLRKCMFLEREMMCPQYTWDFLKSMYGDRVYTPNSKCFDGEWWDGHGTDMRTL